MTTPNSVRVLVFTHMDEPRVFELATERELSCDEVTRSVRAFAAALESAPTTATRVFACVRGWAQRFISACSLP
jgi:hypothetical protein